MDSGTLSYRTLLHRGLHVAGKTRRDFGSLRKLNSGRWQATYTGLDLKRHNAPNTFDSKGDAEAWLAAREREIRMDEWRPTSTQPRLTFETWARQWLQRRTLSPKTVENYEWLLTTRLIPTFGSMPLRSIRIEDVDEWYRGLDAGTRTTNAKAYSFLSTLMKDAVARGHIVANPCLIRGAGNNQDTKRTVPATPSELEVIVGAMPDRLRLMVLLAAWCALRSGEVRELRRRDLDLDRQVVSVTRSVVRVGGQDLVKKPKTRAGMRIVAIPPHVLPAVQHHLDNYAPQPDSLLFPSAGDPEVHLAQSTLTRSFYPARDLAGRPDLSFHDLRHTGASFASEAGATLATNMHRLGHATVGAAMRYQHALEDSDRRVAQQMSEWVARETKNR